MSVPTQSWSCALLTKLADREEAKREEDFSFSQEFEDEEEDEEWEGEGDWTNEGDEAEDIKDESTAYLEFLNEEVRCAESRKIRSQLTMLQAQKFNVISDEDDDELEEESLLETPLDKLEPYGLFKTALLST